MKKILSFFLVFLIAASLFGCNNAIIYDEETTVNGWLKERTRGYVQISPSSHMILFKEEEGFKIGIDTGTDMIPKLKLENDEENTVTIEANMLSATAGEELFSAATHAPRVFDPYRNRYTRAMQVWKKDDATFRIFFWLYGEDTDFYPVPKLLTQEQYTAMTALVEEYNAKKQEESLAANEKIVNYTADFLNLYQGSYYSEKAENPDGNIFYECTGTTEYATVYRDLFSELELSEQDWRNSFASLGYTGQKLNLQIVYCDLSVNDASVDLTLHTEDGYTSAFLKSKNTSLSYVFCPALAELNYVNVKIK